jgi:hypothetical protein
MDSFLEWWLNFRFKIKAYFIPFWVILAVVSGLILILSGIRVDQNPAVLHALEFIFTFSLNIIFLYELVRVPAEEQMTCLVAYPVFMSMIAFSLFTVCMRVIPYFSFSRPWYVSFELSILQRSWMNLPWMIIVIIGGLIVLTVTLLVTSKARFGDLIRPILGFIILTIFTNSLINLYLYVTNYR